MSDFWDLTAGLFFIFLFWVMNQTSCDLQGYLKAVGRMLSLK